MYISKGMKTELQAAGINPEDKVLVKQFYDEKRAKVMEDNERARTEERLNYQRLTSRAKQLTSYFEPHEPSAAEYKLFEFIKDATKGKIYKWMYLNTITFGTVEPEFFWAEIREDFKFMGLTKPERFDLRRLVACGLLIIVDGHYKTMDEFHQIHIYDHPIELFKTREDAVNYLIDTVGSTTMRMKQGKAVFTLRDLIKDLVVVGTGL